MTLFESFTSKAPNKVFISILLGAVAGVGYSLLIPLVLAAIKDDSSGLEFVESDHAVVWFFEVAKYPFALLFLAVCLTILICRTLSQVILTRVSTDVSSKLRIKLYRRISRAPITKLESMGSPRLIAALTIDVPRIIMGARLLPDLLINLVTLFGMLGFLLYLNSKVFWFTLMCIVFGIVTYQIPMTIARRYFSVSRFNIDDLQSAIKALIYGSKELKLNDAKREAFFEEVLLRSERRVLQADKLAYTVVSAAVNYGGLLSFFIIGVISFVFINYHSISNQELVGVVMALLYVTGPVSMLLNFIPQIAVAKVSLRAVNRLLKEIPIEGKTIQSEKIKWSEIKFTDVLFAHPNNDDKKTFVVGPVSFSLRKGEITFLVGGNGSGKSTLSKLITLHYMAQKGEIKFDDTVLDIQNLNNFRQDFSAIYSDYYLFEKILGSSDSQMNEKVVKLLKLFDLDKKVTFEENAFSTLSLSDGQKRRLALIVSILDDKDIYLFDEWAADQDPSFKAIFYRKILPELKAMGKCIVVVSHDDRYFNVADNVIVLEDGKIKKYEQLENSSEKVFDPINSILFDLENILIKNDEN